MRVFIESARSIGEGTRNPAERDEPGEYHSRVCGIVSRDGVRALYRTLFSGFVGRALLKTVIGPEAGHKVEAEVAQMLRGFGLGGGRHARSVEVMIVDEKKAQD
jgi:hypothetical protein